MRIAHRKKPRGAAWRVKHLLPPDLRVRKTERFSAPSLFSTFSPNIPYQKMEGIESIKNLNIVNRCCDEVDDLYANYQGNCFNYMRFLNACSLPKNMFKEVGIYIVLCIGFLFIYQGKMNFISLVTFNSILALFVDPIDNVIRIRTGESGDGAV